MYNAQKFGKWYEDAPDQEMDFNNMGTRKKIFKGESFQELMMQEVDSAETPQTSEPKLLQNAGLGKPQLSSRNKQPDERDIINIKSPNPPTMVIEEDDSSQMAADSLSYADESVEQQICSSVDDIKSGEPLNQKPISISDEDPGDGKRIPIT